MIKLDKSPLKDKYVLVKRYNGKTFFYGKVGRWRVPRTNIQSFDQIVLLDLVEGQKQRDEINSTRKKLKLSLEPADKHIVQTYRGRINRITLDFSVEIRCFTMQEFVRYKIKMKSLSSFAKETCNQWDTYITDNLKELEHKLTARSKEYVNEENKNQENYERDVKRAKERYEYVKKSNLERFKKQKQSLEDKRQALTQDLKQLSEFAILSHIKNEQTATDQKTAVLYGEREDA